MGLFVATLVCHGACTNEGDQVLRSSTAARATRPGTEGTTRSEPPDVVLDDVRYQCGATDAIVIGFEASADVPFTGLAELVVLGDTYGSIRVEVGSTPSEHLMDIDLSQEAFDARAGLVRVRSWDGTVVASERVVLRLENGVSCG